LDLQFSRLHLIPRLEQWEQQDWCQDSASPRRKLRAREVQWLAQGLQAGSHGADIPCPASWQPRDQVQQTLSWQPRGQIHQTLPWPAPAVGHCSFWKQTTRTLLC
jgi:hypothetical protein